MIKYVSKLINPTAVIIAVIALGILVAWVLWPEAPRLPDYGASNMVLTASQPGGSRCSSESINSVEGRSARRKRIEACNTKIEQDRIRNIGVIDQHRASDAAVASVWIAVWQSKVNVLGLILSGFTLASAIAAAIYSYMSAREAGRAAHYAGENHWAFTRVEDAHLVVSMSNGIIVTGTDMPRISMNVEIYNIGRSAALIGRFATDVGSVVIVDNIVVAPNETVKLPVRVQLQGLRLAGESFDGAVHYHTAVSGQRQMDFTGVLIDDSTSGRGMIAMIMPKELPVNRTRSRY